MTNVAHSSITGSNLHENKGVASASDNTVATASSGATTWQKLTASHLTGTGNPFGGQLLHVRGAGSNLLTTGSWVTRTLSTAVTNEISSATLGSNQISLPAGTYFIQAFLGGQAGPSEIESLTSISITGRLYNVNTSSSVVSSMPYANAAGNAYGIYYYPNFLMPMMQRFTLSGSTALEVQHNSNYGVYSPSTEVTIWKVA